MPLAGFETVGIGGENTHGREDSGRDVGQRRAAFDRRSVGPLPGETHDAAHRLRHQIEAAPMLVGAGAAKAGQRAVDQGRVRLADFGVTETEPVHHAGAEVFNQHVRRSDQAPQHLRAARCLQIQGNALLVAVHHQE